MNLATIFDHASSVMTVISCSTFVGILGWTFWVHRECDFAEAAALPFADAVTDTDTHARIDAASGADSSADAVARTSRERAHG
jgi:cytochrome c oxidase cbb3-type subunit 4